MTAPVDLTNLMDIGRHAAEVLLAVEALRVLEGDRQARANLARPQRDQAEPDQLAVIGFEHYGAAVRGCCGVIAEALGGRHG